MGGGEGRSRFVGRDTELATVGRAIDDARGERPTLLLVGGDAGIGKSTLVHEAAHRAKAAAFLGRAVHVGGDALPLAPLFDLIRQVGRSAQAKVFERPELAPLVSSGRDMPAGGVFLPVLELVGALGADDVVVVGFEDLHWADAVTWELFEFLARNLVDEHAVLVGTYRADEVGRDPLQRRRLAELTRLPGAQRVHLAGLGRDEVATRVAELLGGTPPPGLVDEVLSRGEGNPFFTEELVAAHLQGEALPSVLSDLLAADLDALNPLARQVLAAAAVVGRDAPQELLAAVVAQPDDAVEQGLHEALDHQMLVVDRDTGHYRFRHPLIGEIVYDTLLPSECRRLHARVAEWLQAAPRATGADADAQLAFHLDRGGDQRAAFAAWLRAADAAEQLSTAAAAAHLDRALELWDDALPTSERIRRLWKAAELHNATGNNEHSIDLARTALDLGEPPKGWAWGYERLGRFLWVVGRLDESTVAYDRAAALVAESEGSHIAPEVYAGLAQADLMRCRLDSSERWATQALAALEDAPDDVLARLIALRILGVCFSQQRRAEEAIDACREAIAVAEKASAPAHIRLLVVAYLVITLMDAGRYAEALATAMDGEAEGQRAGLGSSHGAYLAAEAAEILVRTGRWAEADTMLRAHPDTEAIPIAAIRLGVTTALLAARRGDPAGAEAALARIADIAIDDLHAVIRDTGTAEVDLALGRWSDAIALAESSWQMPGAAGPMSPARLAMVLAVATVEGLLDARARREPTDGDATATQLRERLAIARRAVSTTASAEDVAALADAEATIGLLGEPDPESWERAAETWRRAGDVWMAARAEMYHAEAAAAVGRAAVATDALRRAYETAVTLGAAGLTAQIDAVAKRTRISVEAPVPAALDTDAVSRLGLTAREAEVLELVAAGMTNREIGERLYVSEKTASVHISNILRKLGVTSRVEAAAVAQRVGIG